MQACSLKFCTAIERPAPIRLWPRCCSSAFIGTTRIAADRAEQDQERRRDPDVRDEVHRDHQHAHRDAQRDHAGGLVEPHAHRRDHRADRGADRDHAAPATRPASCCSPARPRPRPARCSAGCRDTPQNSVVVASEIWPSLSLHSRALQLREVAHQAASALCAIGCSGASVRGMRRLNSAASTYSDDDRQRSPLRARVSMPVSNSGRSKPSRLPAIALADQLAAEQHAQDDRARSSGPRSSRWP